MKPMNPMSEVNCPMNVDDSMIDLKEFAALCRVNIRTVYRLIAKKELPQPLKVGHSVRFFKSDVVDYFERLKRQRQEVPT